MNKRFIGITTLLLGLIAHSAFAADAQSDDANLKSNKMAFSQTQLSHLMLLAAADLPAEEPAVGADGFRLPPQKVKSTAAAIPPLASDKTPTEVAMAAEKGTLKNPYSYTLMNPDLVEAGRKKYMSVSCNGCHGGNGGGGMCPPLSNETWVYGADDDTLFRLVALGSDELLKQGYTRKGRENVVGPMPPHGNIVKTEDDLWRIIYFIRANFRGDPKNIKW
jgi:mono/diheme cytochrome c family protein